MQYAVISHCPARPIRVLSTERDLIPAVIEHCARDGAREISVRELEPSGSLGEYLAVLARDAAGSIRLVFGERFTSHVPV
jgi:hypothetical protein